MMGTRRRRVPILRILLIAAAALGAVAQFLQERRRLEVIKGLSGRQARDYYEATRERGERFMIAVTVVLALAGAAALIITFGIKR
jgi:hypothetical protein